MVIAGYEGSAGRIPLRRVVVVKVIMMTTDHSVEDRYSVFGALSDALCVLYSLL